MEANSQTGKLADLDQKKIPQHVAIIMDGNGRWAEEREQPRAYGHRCGVDSVRDIIEAAVESNIRVLTLYAFSDENWGRPEQEVTSVFSLLDHFLVAEQPRLMKNNVRLMTVGSFSALPQGSKDRICETQEFLAKNDGLILNLALSYGSRSEISQACKDVCSKVLAGELNLDDIKPEVVEQHLWTAGLPDPDLMIRTSGEQRISNFLLWQMAYTELVFSPVFWPDFRRDHFYTCILEFQRRKRRFGLTSER